MLVARIRCPVHWTTTMNLRTCLTGAAEAILLGLEASSQSCAKQTGFVEVAISLVQYRPPKLQLSEVECREAS